MSERFKPTQNERQISYDLTRIIREMGKNNEFVIQKGLRNKPEWKEYLLPLVTDNFIFNHLEHIQPFCAHSISDSLIEYKIPYYYYPLYIKVRLDTKEVVSFRYDVNGNTDLKSYQQNGKEVCDIITDPNDGIGKFTLSFGSNMYTEENVIPISTDASTKAIEKNNLEEKISAYRNTYLERLMRRLNSYFNPFERKEISKLLKDNKMDSKLTLISKCYDIFIEDKYNRTWLKESIVTYLSFLSKETLKYFVERELSECRMI